MVYRSRRMLEATAESRKAEQDAGRVVPTTTAVVAARVWRSVVISEPDESRLTTA